ncbi:nuclear transport factor 2 family protein [Rhodococcus sp. ARC_M12]|uniref:nuclear transport factor 2 family protein n=1 Tax=Rhodococcus sp. ARC_M12 TaxID=2928854 RepID=UPI001FB37148|nr:nuclear transport factor 2 family protein [Rhodococcus sp. ARC_M12]MCJ0978914.1 nuclear transport factor 2 family protein [Rhodococcus sp. ARC_M12]
MNKSQIIDRYFELATRADSEPYFALFAPDAVVEDEGREHHGIDAIRRWRTEVPQVRYDVLSVVESGTGSTTTAQISGDFPGSPVNLSYWFELAQDGRIAVLRIRV